MSFLKEFRTFAMRGNVVDLAVGIIIGAAFGRIVSSLVSDVLMPPLGMVVGGIDFGQFGVTLKEAVGTSPAVILKYGVFLNSIIDFVIVAVAVFFLIHTMNRLQKKDPPAPPPPPAKEVLLLTEIRDLLKAQQ